VYLCTCEFIDENMEVIHLPLFVRRNMQVFCVLEVIFDVFATIGTVPESRHCVLGLSMRASVITY